MNTIFCDGSVFVLIIHKRWSMLLYLILYPTYIHIPQVPVGTRWGSFQKAQDGWQNCSEGAIQQDVPLRGSLIARPSIRYVCIYFLSTYTLYVFYQDFYSTYFLACTTCFVLKGLKISKSRNTLEISILKCQRSSHKPSVYEKNFRKYFHFSSY